MGLFKRNKSKNEAGRWPGFREHVYNASDSLLQGQGPCPSGTLTVSQSTRKCPGFPCKGTIELEYVVPDGVQKSYHPHPGTGFTGTKRVAFLPDNDEGQELLKRLIVAFYLGQTLDVGYSAARKEDHQTRWRDCVPHKTSLAGGPFGFPDGTFLSKAHTELDRIGIPDAQACHRFLPRITSHADAGQHVARLVYDSSQGVAYSTAVATALTTLLAGPPTVPSEVVQCQHPLSILGNGPPGSMSINLTNQNCPGFDSKTIEIRYTIRSGIQEEYHETPNARFDGADRTAYLPDTPDGRDLLQRLKYAFQYGYTFRIGTSEATGFKNQTTWTTIPHKTSLCGGPFGFPDADYIETCNRALDALHIPATEKRSPVAETTTSPTPAPTASAGQSHDTSKISPIGVPELVMSPPPATFPTGVPVDPTAVPPCLMPAAAIPLDDMDSPTDTLAMVPSAPPPPPPTAPQAPDAPHQLH